jgi:hypothetical protein
MASTLIIGIGSTGLNIIEEAQQFHYEFTGKNKPGNNVEYLYLETNLQAKSKKTASGLSNIELVGLSLGQNAVDITRLKENKNIDSTWLPEATSILQAEDGAGSMPSYGRLSLWGAANYSRLKEVIIEKYQRIGGNQDTQILVVGSLTGGTGSGLCVDIAYLLKDITNNTNINAVFLLPGGNDFGANKALFENSFSALTSIFHYTQPENPYNVNWPDGSSTESLGPPYQYCQFLSLDFTGAQHSIKSLNELVRVAGMNVCLQILDSEKPIPLFNNLISARRVDSTGNDRIKNIISGGFLMVQYPKAQLEEILAIKLSAELLKQLIDNTQFVDKHGNKKNIQGETPKIKNEARVKLEDIINNSFLTIDSITSLNGGTLISSLKNDAEKVLKKTHGKDSDKKFVFDLFSTKQNGNYFEIVKDNNSLIKDSFINEIEKFVSEISSQYKNFNLVKIVVQELRDYIGKIISFYERDYKLKGKDEEWDGLIGKTIDLIFDDMSSYGLIGKKKDYLEYSFIELLNMTKIHTCIPVLKKLEQDLASSLNSIKSSSGVILPSEKSLNDIIDKIDYVVNREGDVDNYTFNRRNNELGNVLERFSSCFKVVYTSGSKDTEINQAYDRYIQDSSGKMKFFDIILSDNIYNYFTKTNVEYYTDFVSNSIRFVKNKNLFNNASLDSIINGMNNDTNENQALLSLFRSQPAVIKNKIPAMIKLGDGRYSFGQDACAKLCVLTSDHNKYSHLFPSYQITPTQSNTVDIPSLKETIIFYQEYGYMGDGNDQHFNPLKHISYMDEVKTYLKSTLTEEFKKKKVPYLSIEQFKKYLS